MKSIGILFTFLLLSPGSSGADAPGTSRQQQYLAPHANNITIADIPPRMQEAVPLAYDAPGDSIGFTTFDYLTNGSIPQILINYTDGRLSLARMASTLPDRSDLGSYVLFYDGSSWGPWWSRIEPDAVGWTSTAQLADAGGINVVVSEAGGDVEVYVDAAWGANTWTLMGSFRPAYWPRLGIGSGFSFHLIHCDRPDPTSILYSRSPDAGTTFDIIGMPLFSHPGLRIDPDGYDIAVQGQSIAVIVSGQGGDVVLVESTNGGDSWTETVIYDAAGGGELPEGTEQWQPDGACAIAYDASGKINTLWSNYLAIGDSEDNPQLYYNCRCRADVLERADWYSPVEPLHG